MERIVLKNYVITERGSKIALGIVSEAMKQMFETLNLSLFEFTEIRNTGNSQFNTPHGRINTITAWTSDDIDAKSFYLLEDFRPKTEIDTFEVFCKFLNESE